MSFLRPEFLVALPLVALPIIIHLMNRRRYQIVNFSAVEFLRRAVKRTRRRVLLEDLLLLILRTLAVLLLILALAHPGANPDDILGARPARAEVLVLDGSLSMNLREAGASSFERAVARGVERLNDLESGRGDLAAVILAGTEAERTAYGNPEEVRAALLELTSSGMGRAAMAQALAMARQTAAALMNEGPERVNVTVLTDLQATGWDLSGSEGEALRTLAADGYALSVVDTGGARRRNTAVTWLDVEPAEISPGEFGEAHARIRNFGEESRRVRATLTLDGVPVAQTELSLGREEEQVWTHPISPAETGTRAVEVQLDGDELTGDDRRGFIVRVRPAPRVLLVGEPAPGGQAEGVYGSVRQFLDLGPQAPVRLDSRSPGRLDAAILHETDVVVLADPGRLPVTAVRALVEFSDRGGGILLALGTETAQADEFLKSLGGPDLSFHSIAPVQSPTARLRMNDPEHPALTFFADPRWQPLLTEVPFERFRVLQWDTADEELPGFQVPLQFVTPTGEERDVDQGAALLEWKREGGRVAVLAAAPNPLWNGMTAVPGGTLPFLLDLVTYLAPKPGHDLEVEVGSPLAVELPRAPTEVTLTDPSGRASYPASAAVELPGGRALQPLVDRAGEAGIWTMSATMLDRDGVEMVHRERLAVLTPPGESDPAPLDASELSAMLPPGTLVSEDAEGEPEDEGLASAGRPQDLSHLFYMAVAGMLLLETLLASLLDRRRG